MYIHSHITIKNVVINDSEREVNKWHERTSSSVRLGTYITLKIIKIGNVLRLDPRVTINNIQTSKEPSNKDYR